MDAPIPGGERQKTPERANLLWTREIEREIDVWQRTGNFPFPDMYLFPVPSPRYYSTEDLRLIHHVASVSRDMELRAASKFNVWTSKIPRYEFQYTSATQKKKKRVLGRLENATH
jgi:hypothetical protein